MTRDGGNGLTRTSSLILNSPTKSSAPGKRLSKIVVDSVPDSEEDRGRNSRLYKGDIIELSSESDDDRTKEYLSEKKLVLVADDSDPFLSSSRKVTTTLTRLSKEVIEESETEDDSDGQPLHLPKSGKLRRTVISESEEESEAEERSEVENGTDAEADRDGAILTLNDPPSSRKPAVRKDAVPSKLNDERPSVTPLVYSTQSGGQILVADPSPVPTPVLLRPKGAPGTQAKLPDFFSPKGKLKKKGSSRDTREVVPSPATVAPVTPGRSKSTAKRKTKKELEQEKQAHLAAYAQSLFDELNASVFKGRLAKDTPLVWNKRLLATAGRAKWHRDSKGVVTASIELATKVLDCEERIRNTLSHEMCHLACWVINCNPKENHGGVWRGWVDEVMEKRPDILITTKHSYDITYKYEWQCQTATCKKIYGRFSNSIDTEKSICGVCKVGELVPLFKKRARKANATSKLAADKPRDSPILSTSRPTGVGTPTPSPFKSRVDHGVILITSDPDSDHETLSGADTDTRDRIYVAEPKKDLQEITQLGRPNDSNTRNGAGVDDVRKLVTHMSIIDLTGD